MNIIILIQIILDVIATVVIATLIRRVDMLEIALVSVSLKLTGISEQISKVKEIVDGLEN